METIGQVEHIKTEREIEWKILNFSSLSEKNSTAYCSPEFSFCNESWCVKMYPNGKNETSTGYVSLFLIKTSSGPPIKIKYSLGLKTLSGEKDSEVNTEDTFEKAENGYGYPKFISRSDLFKRKADLLPSDVITLFYTLQLLASLETPGFDKLSNDLKAIMLSGDHSDTVVKVKTEEFHVHKSIIAARNSYFDAMFKTDMTEKSTDIITIQDCEPNIFRSFIHFIYTGKLDKISPENVCELYKVADKYQEDQLRKICLKYMLNNVSADNFCDYFTLAFTYDEKELLQKGIEFFTTNGKEIVRSVKWQKFLKEYSTQANELLIRHFDYIST